MSTAPLPGSVSESLWKLFRLGKVKLCFRVATSSAVFVLFPESQRLSLPLTALPPAANSERANVPHMRARMFLECGMRPEILHGRRVTHVNCAQKGPRARSLPRQKELCNEGLLPMLLLLLIVSAEAKVHSCAEGRVATFTLAKTLPSLVSPKSRLKRKDAESRQCKMLKEVLSLRSFTVPWRSSLSSEKDIPDM